MLGLAATYDSQVTYDLAGKSVEARRSEVRGPFDTAVRGFWTIRPHGLDDSTEPVLTTQPLANIIPPADSGSRGTYLAHMVSAALQTPCAVPSHPANTDNTAFTSGQPP